MQSSITAWLKKPASVKEAPTPPTTKSINAFQTTPSNLPTPPPEESGIQHEHPQNEQNDSSQPSKQAPPIVFGLANKNLQPLISNITLEACTQANISSFKRLNTLLLPIPYPPKFYDEILSDSTTQSLTLLAIWRDKSLPAEQPGRVIGGIRCRLLSASAASTAGLSTTSARRDSAPDPLLYISTLMVLSPYRHYGIATHLLSRITTFAMQQYKINAVGAHVWVNNEEGRAWYKKRGFGEDKIEEAYYRRLEPKAAVVVLKKVGVGDLLGKG